MAESQPNRENSGTGGSSAGTQRLIEKGAGIAGGAFAALAGSAASLVLTGPEGALAGGAAGSGLTMSLQWLGQEMSARLLGPREEKRIGYVFTLAAAEISERIKAGEQVRQDRFFGNDRDGRSDGEEVWESILLKSQREAQEKKLPYMAHLFANLAFESDIGADMAHQITKAAEQFTYRQLCILKLVSAKGQYDIWDIYYSDARARFSEELYQLFYEYLDLHNRHYISSGTGAGLTNFVPSDVVLQGIGAVTCRMMKLAAIPREDVLPIVELLKLQ